MFPVFEWLVFGSPLYQQIIFTSGPFNPASDFQFAETFPASPEPEAGSAVPDMAAAETAHPPKETSPDQTDDFDPEEATPTEIFIQVEPDTVQDQHPVPQASTSTSGDLQSGAIAPTSSTAARKTSQSHPGSSASHNIVKAPRVMAKSTGGFFPPSSKRGHRSVFGSRSSSPSPSVYHPDFYGDMSNVQSTSSFQPENGAMMFSPEMQQGWFSRLDRMFAEGIFSKNITIVIIGLSPKICTLFNLYLIVTNCTCYYISEFLKRCYVWILNGRAKL